MRVYKKEWFVLPEDTQVRGDLPTLGSEAWHAVVALQNFGFY